jgi:hypothetical protein
MDFVMHCITLSARSVAVHYAGRKRPCISQRFVSLNELCHDPIDRFGLLR